MIFDFNIRQESFGATLLSLSDGKRRYLTKDELKNIIYHEDYPMDISTTSSEKVKYTKLKPNERLLNHLSFADILYVELTRKCNLHCKHCLNDSGNQLNDELEYDDLVKLINDMVKSGAQEIRFTGGEPLMNPHIFELIALANSLGIYTSIDSNGTLISKEIANKLKEAGLKKAFISLDGSEEKNDKIRGALTYKKAIMAISYLQSSGINVEACSVIMNNNKDDIINLYKKLSKDKIHLTIRDLVERNRAENLIDEKINNSDYAFFLERMNHIDPNLYSIYKEEDPRHEQIFKKAIGFRINHRKLYISANGNIYLNEVSSVSTLPFGNCKEMEDYRDFWNEIYKQNYLKKIRENIIA